MPDYDFRCLSPIDFEILVRDLLQEQLGITFESFKAGKDQGIDLRYSTDSSHQIIVQCKHYVESGYSALKSTLKKSELLKVRKLSPKRYILATSIPLSPQQKQDIKKLLSPFIKKATDIISQNDLNNLLGKFPQIERDTIKLWVGSTRVLEEVLHGSIKNISRLEKERLKEHAKLYVKNESFSRALKILDDYNFCIIAGPPGIGKTFLAEMLVLHYCYREYELIKISNDIQEAFSFIISEAKRVYYYDDFLGQISYSEKLHKNEDQRLIDFIHAIRKTKGSKLILTTREYILNRATQQSEKLDRENFGGQKCIVDLGSYTRRIRAEILYNHLYFSEQPHAFTDSLLRAKRYLKIIDHRNYNPRLIQLMTEPGRLEGIEPVNYFKFITQNFDTPTKIWEHAFKNHLSQGARNMLVVLFFLPSEVFIDDLTKAFGKYHSTYSGRYVTPFKPYDSNSALRELEGDFISINREDKLRIVTYCNPSVRDFINQHLLNSPEELRLLAESIIYFEQLDSLWKSTGAISGRSSIIDFGKDNQHSFQKLIAHCINAPPCHIVNVKSEGKFSKEKWPTSFEEKINLVYLIANNEAINLEEIFSRSLSIIVERIDNGSSDKQWLVALLKNLPSLKFISSKQRESILEKGKTFMLESSSWPEDLVHLCQLIKANSGLFGNDDRNKAKRAAVKIANETSELCWEHDPEDIRVDAEILKDVAEQLDVNINEQLENMESQAMHIESAREEEEYEDERYRPISRESDWCSDNEIEAIFDTLRSK